MPYMRACCGGNLSHSTFVKMRAEDWVTTHTQLYDKAKESERTRAQWNQFHDEDMRDASTDDLPMDDVEEESRRGRGA